MARHRGTIPIPEGRPLPWGRGQAISGAQVVGYDDEDEPISTEPLWKSALASLKGLGVKAYCILAVWAALYWVAVQVEFGVVYFVVSLLLLVYTSMGSSDGKEEKTSAYSVFNKHGKQLPGTFTTQSLESSFGLPQYKQ